MHARLIGRATLRFLFGHPAHFVALGMGAGLSPVAPGTIGTLLAFPLFWWLNAHLAADDFLIVLGFMFVAGVWACDRTARDLRVKDPGAIVWDEVTAFMMVLFFTPPTLVWQAIAFLLFRLFDILKPGPVRYVESKFRGGFGVMIDDIVAGFLALLGLALAKAVGERILV